MFQFKFEISLGENCGTCGKVVYVRWKGPPPPHVSTVLAWGESA